MERSHTVANLDTLSTIARSPRLAKAIIKSAEETLIDAISECALQIVRGTVQVTEKSKADRVKSVLPFIKFLTRKNVSKKRKRNFLLKGGVSLLSLILPPVISYITQSL